MRGSYNWVISPPIWAITIVTLLITLLITTHEPPSRSGACGFWLGFGVQGVDFQGLG